MRKAKWFAPLVVAMLLLGCGPDTIFVRPGLDTPSQHVDNGHRLLERGKVDDACREFSRARELDPNYIKAYVGLGVALGHKGDISAGMQTISMAEQMVNSNRDYEVVQEGYEQLNILKRARESRQ